MKTIFISLFLCLMLSLAANETKDRIIEEPTIDTLKPFKEQFSQARKKGWDFSDSKSKNQLPNNTRGELKPATPPNYHPMRKSEELMNIFRSDLPEGEKGKQMDRLHELDHSFTHPQKKKNSRKAT
jgi:hypothetical protein